MHYNPMVVAFTPKKLWKWLKVKVTFATVDMETFYLDVANRGKIWRTSA